MLELTLEGGAECYQAFHVGKTACTKAQMQCKAYHVQGIIPSLNCWSRKCEDSIGSKTEGETF